MIHDKIMNGHQQLLENRDDVTFWEILMNRRGM